MTGDLIFWVIAGALSCAVAGLLILAARRGRGAGRSASASDISVYRDQLAEVERDLARGIVTETEADAVKIEVSRRLLAADAARDHDAATARGGAFWAALIVVLCIAGGGVVYLWVGAPGYGDLPIAERIARADALRAERPSQAEIEARVPRQAPPAFDERLPELVAQLRAALAERPDDLRGYVLLARNEAAMGNFTAAYQAQARVAELSGRASDYADLADLMILAAGGYVSPEAEAALGQALNRDPGNGTARYYAGLLAAQIGRPDQAFALWRVLLEESEPNDPWVAPIRDQLPEVASLSGERYQLPPLADLPGPTADDVAAAMDMAPEDRAAMIEGMVEGLAQRLATDGGPAADWARLIGALSVLGRQEEAAAIAAEARTVFADSEAALEIIDAARAQAGISE